MLDIHGIMKELSKRRPVFHSEADFQLALFRQINCTEPTSDPRMEVKAYKGSSHKRLDLLVRSEEEVTAIELKFWNITLDVVVNDERFVFDDSSNRSQAWERLWDDVSRIRNELTVEAHGHAIALTNDSRFLCDSVRLADFDDAKWASEYHPGSRKTSPIVTFHNSENPTEWVGATTPISVRRISQFLMTSPDERFCK